MKRIVAFALIVVSSLSLAHGAVVFDDDFDAYVVGDLVGQGGWMLGNSMTNPIQVIEPVAGDKVVQLVSTGQDDYKAFVRSVPHTDGNALITEFDVTLSAAQSNGDFFAHLTAFAGATLATDFLTRIYARTNPETGTGFVLGFVDIGPLSGGTPTVTYGMQELALGTQYHVTTTWNFVPGPLNDTFRIAVDNVPYLETFWMAQTPEPATIGAFNLRQGSAAGGPTVSAIDNVLVTELVPEASTLVFAVLGAGMLLPNRRAAKRPPASGNRVH
jgi:hypothetical protein